MADKKFVNGKWWYNKIGKTASVSFPEKEFGETLLTIAFPNGQTRRIPPGTQDLFLYDDWNVFPDEQILIRAHGNFAANIQLQESFIGVVGQIQIDNYVNQGILTWEVKRIDRLSVAITNFCDPSNEYGGSIRLNAAFQLTNDYVPPPDPPDPPIQNELKLWCKVGGEVHKAKKLFVKQNGEIVPVKKIFGR
ncbi:MAG: hypothetical protein Q4A78_12365 [Peptostreptococcaceae bacterium]|nr:hypothetical protein [Peptostreptococcaceae bacterium]